MSSNNHSLKYYIKHYKRVLDGFLIPMDAQIEDTIKDIYPNEIALENYIRGVIMKHLSKYE